MSWSWMVWVVGTVLLIAAGFVAVVLPRLRAAGLERRTAWSGAQAAIDTAAVSRDACPAPVAEADELLNRAELILAGRGGRIAAGTAAAYAQQADRLWRDASGD